MNDLGLFIHLYTSAGSNESKNFHEKLNMQTPGDSASATPKLLLAHQSNYLLTEQEKVLLEQAKLLLGKIFKNSEQKDSPPKPKRARGKQRQKQLITPSRLKSQQTLNYLGFD